MSSVSRVRVTAVLVLVLIFSATANAQMPKAAPVRLVEVAEQAIYHSVELSGTVTAERSAQLSVATGGLVSALFVDAGSIVSKGDTLLSMDSELAKLQWESAEAAVRQAGHALADAERRLREARRLAPQQSIAETEVLNLVAEVSEDEAALQASVAMAGYRKGIFNRHTLGAPFAGVISRRMTELGEWLNPGQAVLELVAIDSLRLDFRVPEDNRRAIGEDTQITFALADNNTEEYSAKVAAIVPVADPTDRTFLLRAVAENPVSRMIPGNSVRARFTLATALPGLVVPRDAVLRHSDGRSIVWVVDDSMVASERLVRTGLNFDDLIEIKEGLAAGDAVVVEGNESLRNGQVVSSTDVGGH